MCLAVPISGFTKIHVTLLIMIKMKNDKRSKCTYDNAPGETIDLVSSSAESESDADVGLSNELLQKKLKVKYHNVT